MSGPGWPTNTATGSTTGVGDGARHEDSLLCIDGDRSFTVRLPPSGELVIGRGPEAGLSVDDPQVSRAHVQLLASPGGLRIADLGSRHGTFVNGERLTEPRILQTGDVVMMGNVLVIARQLRRVSARSVVDRDGFVRRLADELARCIAFERELSLICIRYATRDDNLVTRLGERVRAIDTIAPIDSRHIGVLLPELDADEAHAFARRLCETTHGAHVGLATAPYDGIDADSLLAATRAACELGRGIVHACDAAEILHVEGRAIVVGDPAMAKLYELARRVARSSIPVLVTGETGVGKELAAATVHASSPRASGPFVSVNCAAIPETLAESELFGHLKGAFSGAMANKVGFIEAADGGTLFLDEIGELSLVTQAKLLRVLESGELVRVGEVKPRKIDMRIVAATNRDLQRESEAGRFRSDLFFRLGAARLEIPPLRERARDLALLSSAMLRDACMRLGRTPLALSIPVAVALFRHEWPGNIRELRHVIDYAAATVPDAGTTVELWHLPQSLAAAARRERDGDALPQAAALAAAAPLAASTVAFRPIADEVRELERMRMIEALRASGGVQNRAADLIEMPLRTFVTKLKRYAIRPDEYAHG